VNDLPVHATERKPGPLITGEPLEVQTPHRDQKPAAFHELHRDAYKRAYIAFTPLTEEGMHLEAWPTDLPEQPSQQNPVEGHIVFIPFRSFLMLPISAVHAGGFRTAFSDPAKAAVPRMSAMKFFMVLFDSWCCYCYYCCYYHCFC
jgi:hypothetical protein